MTKHKTEQILIYGAKVHNLKNIDIKLPRDKFIIITGLSGSGKSSLAFDTIYAEGQRKFVESLSAYARQFLEQLQKPDLEKAEGLSPTISIEQRTTRGNPRSTVATQTEIYDYLRLLFARVGDAYCYKCGRIIKQQSAQEIITSVLSFKQGGKLFIYAPLIRGKKGEYQERFKKLRKEGFIRIRVDGTIYELDHDIKLDKNKRHNIELLLDKLTLKRKNTERISDSIETALRYGEGLCFIEYELGGQTTRKLFSQKFSCMHCGLSYEEIEPRMFSFNSPYGACLSCLGLGIKLEVDPDLVIPDITKSIIEGAIEPWKKGGRGYILYYRNLLRGVAEYYDFDLNMPFKNFSKKIQNIILYGSKDYIGNKRFEGVIPHVERLFKTTDSDYLKEELSKYLSKLPCPECEGLRLKKESLSIKIKGFSISELCQLSVKETKEFFMNLHFDGMKLKISKNIIKEILRRLEYLVDVGLDYLTLSRCSNTLSGGESQRIRLATQIGSGLVGVIYILDEPTIGLHLKDTKKLLNILLKLRDLGNTVIVVEHDEQIIQSADYIVDLGPGAGKAGGKVVYQGNLSNLLKDKNSITAKYLNKTRVIKIPESRRQHKDKSHIEILGAQEHNLKNINVKIPLGLFIAVTGVSGSGKSTLVDEIMYRVLSKYFYRSRLKPGKHKSVLGINNIDKVVVVDQSPIGRTPRSNPATYTGLFTPLREFFTLLPESRMRGYKPGRFSFNVKGGRCEVCQGDGVRKIEMHFLPDVYVDCDLCKGKRYNSQTLEISYKGKNIADVLDATVNEAGEIFKDIPKIRVKLDLLKDVGLGYIHLGQPAPTLSGGEAQRIKLATELSKRATGRTLYILDEPTTGLHFSDVEKLLKVLQRLVEGGNTVVVIEHNMDVIKCADYIIDLGPGAGVDGGKVVAAGFPEEVAKIKKSYTGKFLKEILRSQ
ncbi:MAG: excinuclease ABC subunit UvrA [Candidatus Saelkia tenebricola]|nr:excinuclease ABC subunit UvrA [Candidatus Saelkia tenebricola]